MSGSTKFLRKLMKLQKASNSPKTSLAKKLTTLANNVKNNIKKVKSDITEDLLDSNKVSSKFIELEYRSRRNNLRIDGISEDQNESCHECEEKVLEVIKEKLEIQDPIEIDRCHRMGKHKRNRPRTIIFKLNKFKDK